MLPHLTVSAHVQCCGLGSSSKPTHMQDLKKSTLIDISNVTCMTTQKYGNAIELTVLGDVSKQIQEEEL